MSDDARDFNIETRVDIKLFSCKARLLYPGLNPSRELIMSVALWWARGSYTGQGGVRLIAGFNVNVMFKEEMRLFRNGN
jgi:hypothetical protein